MKKMVVKGGKKLAGELNVQGAKNAALPIIVASVLINGKTEISNVPEIKDVMNFIEIIEYLGGKIEYKENILIIDNSKIKNKKIPKKISKKTRASFLFYGALLSRFRKAKVETSGGCKIGKRPIDIHTKAFREIEEGKREIVFSFPSVGATENLLIYTSGKKEKFVIRNGSIEPEVLDLVEFLKKIGIRIKRRGRDFFVQGGKIKEKVRYKIMPDRIAALTYIMAGKITNGKVKIKNINYRKYIKPVLKKAEKGNIETGPHPAFPTDAGAIVLPYLALKNRKKTTYKENLFENRLGIIEELYKSGIKAEIEKNEAEIIGVEKITARKMHGRDLRMTAGLILMGLATSGKSEITGIEHLERGYEKFTENLKELGADIELIGS